MKLGGSYYEKRSAQGLLGLAAVAQSNEEVTGLFANSFFETCVRETRGAHSPPLGRDWSS